MLGSGIPCVSIFTCTSPWETYAHGLQKKLVSSLLEEFFYQRGYDHRAATVISLEKLLNAVMDRLRTEKQKAETLEIRNPTFHLLTANSDL